MKDFFLRLFYKVYRPTIYINRGIKKIPVYIVTTGVHAVITEPSYDVIPYPTHKEKIDSLKEDPTSIKYIKYPTEEMQLLAIRRNYEVMKFIKNPTKKVKKEHMIRVLNSR